MPNACFCNPRHPNSDPKIIRKSNLEIDMKKSCFRSTCTQKSLKMGPLNQLKIDKIQAWTSQVLPNVPGSSQDRPRVPQDAKVEAPSMPNDTHGHHKPEICLQKCQESAIQEPASHDCQKGRRQGRSLKIRRTPFRGSWECWISFQILRV